MRNIFFATVFMLLSTGCGFLLSTTTNKNPIDVLVIGDAGVMVESKSGVYNKGREEYPIYGVSSGDFIRLVSSGVDSVYKIYNTNYTHVFDVKKNYVKRDSFPK